MMNVETTTGPSYDASVTAAGQIGLQNQTVGASNQATLLLFENRMVPNQYRRPYLYRFGEPFLNDLLNNIQRSDTRPYSEDDAMMPESTSAKSAILPSGVGTMVDMSQMSMYWTFVLVIDASDGTNLFGMRTTMSTRFLYSGWVIDEPVSRNSCINPNAVLNFSRYINFNEVPVSLGMYGATSRVNTMANWEYASTQLLSQTVRDGTQQFKITPEKAFDSVSYSPFNVGSFQFTPVIGAEITPSVNTVEFDPGMGNPAYHLKKIVKGFKDGIVTARQHMQRDLLDDISTDTDPLFSNVAMNLRDGSHDCIITGIDPSRQLMLSNLIQSFPNMYVQVFRLPHQPTYGLSDAGNASRRNVLSTVVSSSMPGMLIDVGLAEVSFRYDSYDPTYTGPVNSNPGAIKLTSIGMLYQCDETTKANAWYSLLNNLKRSIFPILKEAGGDFILMVNCAITASSLVDLHFLCENDGTSAGEFIETNNLLGGLNTDLIGNSDQLQNNASQLFHAYTQVNSYVAPECDVGPAADYYAGNMFVQDPNS